MGGDLGDSYPFVAPPYRDSLSTRLKRPRELETDTMLKLSQRAPSQRSQQVGGGGGGGGGGASIPQSRKAARATTASPKELRPPSQPWGGIRKVEGGELCPLPAHPEESQLA